jgi:hypothetical protein
MGFFLEKLLLALTEQLRMLKANLLSKKYASFNLIGVKIDFIAKLKQHACLFSRIN